VLPIRAELQRFVLSAPDATGFCAWILHVVSLVYIDETGSVGKGARSQPLLTVAAAIVKEEHVQPLRESMRDIAMKHLGWVPDDLEFHGNVLWNGGDHWSEMDPPQLLTVYKDVIDLLELHDVNVSYASIDKARLHAKYYGGADQNAYLLALQFMLEKIDSFYSSTLKILIADEQKEHQLRAMKMVKNMQMYGLGEVPSFPMKTIIDSIHFVDSAQSPGIQMADMVAYLLQRSWNQRDKHPDVVAAIADMHQAIGDRTHTYRLPWPS
jgi:hypothetical protein